MELKICAMSDLHGQLPQIRQEVDILCISYSLCGLLADWKAENFTFVLFHD